MSKRSSKISGNEGLARIAGSKTEAETVLSQTVPTTFPVSLKVAIVVSLLGIMAFTGLSYTVAYRQMMKNLDIKIDTTLMTLANENAREIDGFFDQIEEDLKLLSSPDIFGSDDFSLSDIEHSFFLLSRNHHYLSFIDPTGKEKIKVVDGKLSHDYKTLTAFPKLEDLLKKPGSVSRHIQQFDRELNPITGIILPIPEVWTAISLPGKDGKAKGIILSRSRMHQFCRGLRELKVGKNGFAMVLNGSGQVVYHPDAERVGQDFKRFPWVREMLWIKGDWHWLDINNVKYRAAVDNTHRLNQLVIIMAPRSDFPREIRVIENVATYIAVAVLMVALIIDFYIFSQLIKQRQKELEQAAKVNMAERTIKHNVELSKANEQLAEAKLLIQDERDKAESIIRSITDGLLVVGPTGVVEYMNSAAERMFRVKRSEVKGHTVAAAFKHQELSDLVEKVQEEGKDILSEDISIMETIGFRTLTTHLKVSVGSLKGEVDEVHGCVVVLRDVTRERELDRLKSEFLSAVSHELRTPLTSIKGTLELLAGGVLGETTDEQDRFLTVTRGECDRLIRLINDLLDLSQIESKRMQLQFRLLDVVETANQVMDSLRPLSEKKGVPLELKHPGKELEIIADRDKLKQILTNLVDNAIKFTEEGSVTVSIIETPRDVQIAVQDTGCGIPEGKIPDLFSKFSQYDGTHTRRSGGTGLGLSITKQLVELHGGRVEGTSEVGVGSCFTIILPRRVWVIVSAVPSETDAVHTDIIKDVLSEEAGKLLVVDDEVAVLAVVERYFQEEGYQVTAVQNPLEARDLFEKQEFDVVLSDLRMKDMDGLDLLREVRKLRPSVPFIIMTAHGSVQTATTAMKEGAFDYIVKPFEPGELKGLVKNAILTTRLLRENESLKWELDVKYNFEHIVGESSAMTEVYELIRRTSSSSDTVLILGESGTGKELVAKAVHRSSPRSTGPFMTVNCAAIPKDLLESELFGYEKGAFTGATTARKGLFEASSGGSLFLDEIAEMPLELQAKLLRVLEEQKVRRVGGTKEKKINVRIITATNRDLKQSVKDGTFREDLFYRIHVLPIPLPPLRDRRDDISLLVKSFVERESETMGRPPISVSGEVLELFEQYQWPGNVRELENTIKRAIIMMDTDRLTMDALPPDFREKSLSVKAGSMVGRLTYKDAKKRIIEGFDRMYLTRLLKEHGGVVTKASKAAGLHEKNLYSKLKELGIDLDSFRNAG